MLLSVSLSTHAQDTLTDEKKRLLTELGSILELEKSFHEMTDLMLGNLEVTFPASLQAEIAKRPNLSEDQKRFAEKSVADTYKRVSRKFRERIGNAVDVRAYLDHMLYTVFSKYYTTSELKDLVAFYKTPTGRKTMEVMPKLMMESMSAAQQYFSPGLEKLTKEIIEEEIDRLTLLSDSNALPETK